MRITTRIAVLLLACTLAGCSANDGGGGVATANQGAAAPSPSSSAPPDEDRPLKFSQCMREQGMDWFPDPEPESGRVKIRVPESVSKKDVEAASAACKQWAPDGGDNGRMNPADLEAARKMSQCMRDNGITNFPDPRADGRIEIDGRKLGAGPGDPEFEAAQKQCDRFRSSGGPTRERE